MSEQSKRLRDAFDEKNRGMWGAVKIDPSDVKSLLADYERMEEAYNAKQHELMEVTRQIGKLLDENARLRKELEQAVKLPKIGDTVYMIGDYGDVYEPEITGYEEGVCIPLTFTYVYNDGDVNTFEADEIGKTVFLTRAEAEAARCEDE
jgi:uncharacterized Rossmann fold enzyme